MIDNKGLTLFQPNPTIKEFGEATAFADHKIRYIIAHASGRDVLDLGCVMHDPKSYESQYWVHKALKVRARNLLGLDLDTDGVLFLRQRGFNIIQGDAQDFDLGVDFDIIHAGDIMEHLENFAGFLECCKRHLRPNGLILISTPNPWYWRNIIKAILHLEVGNNPEHTCWLCPRTLRQLVGRHNLELSLIEFGSRYLRDRYMPLPRGLKHTTWCAALKLKN